MQVIISYLLTILLEKFGDKPSNTPNIAQFKMLKPLECIIQYDSLFLEILKIRYYLEFNVVRW